MKMMTMIITIKIVTNDNDNNQQLFDIAGGGPETDAFKHLAAAFSVLRYFTFTFSVLRYFTFHILMMMMTTV